MVCTMGWVFWRGASNGDTEARGLAGLPELVGALRPLTAGRSLGESYEGEVRVEEEPGSQRVLRGVAWPGGTCVTLEVDCLKCFA